MMTTCSVSGRTELGRSTVRRYRSPLASFLAGLVVLGGLVAVAAPPSVAADSPSGLTSSDASIPVLGWSRVAGAASYDVQVSRTADFATTLASTSTVNQRYVPVIEMPTGDVWWRVRVKAPAVSEWTAASFVHGVPAAPVQVQPPTDAVLRPPSTPRFSWEPVAGATSYTVQTGTDPAFTDPALIIENKQKSTAAYLTGYPEVGAYYWRVRAELSTGYTTAWSGSRPYTVGALAPVVRSAPADVFDKDDPADVFLTDIVLDWEPRAGAATYELRIDTDRNFLSVDHAMNGITGTRYSPLTTLPNDDFYWQVRPVNASGRAAPWPDTPWRFTHAWPDQPQPVYPVGAASVDVPLFYQWEPIERASSYRVRVWNDSGYSCALPPTIHATIAGCRPTTAGTYSWSVSAVDAPSNLPTVAGTTKVAQFDYVPPAPTTAPVGTREPLSGYSVSTSGTAAYGIGRAVDACVDAMPDQCDDIRQTPVLTWNPVPGATSYTLTISNDAEGTNPEATATVSQPMWTPTAALQDSQAGSAYYWKVVPSPCASPCPEAAAGFTHAFAKESVAPDPLSPVAGEEVSNDVVLRWGTWLDALSSPAAAAASDVKAPARMDAQRYVVQTSLLENFSSVLETKTVDQTTFTSFSTTYPEGPIFWRVAALDGDGMQTVWSAPQRFVKRSPVPTLAAPDDGTAIAQDQTLSWEPLAFAKTYDVEVYSGPTKVAGGSTVHTSWSPSTPLPASDTDYTWRVRRVDAVGRAGDWSGTRAFRFAGFAPLQTVPAEGAVVPPSGALFGWQVDPRATSYRFERRKPGSVTDLAETVTTRATSWAPTAAMAAGTAQWRVTALDAAGTALGSSPWRDVVVVDPPAVVTPVTVAGSGRVGSDLRLSAPTFDPVADTTTYQWYRDTTAIVGATAESYTVTGTDLGKALTVRATGVLAGYKNATSTSNAVVAVMGDAPVATDPPVITGTPRFGETLGVQPGTWEDGVALRYQWYRDGSPISGADDPTYRLAVADTEHAVHVVETATVSGRSPGVAPSAAVTIALGAPPSNTTPPVVSGSPVAGQTLRVTAGVWTDRPTLARQWYRDGAAITGATGTSYVLTDADALHDVRVVETATVAGRETGTAATDPVPVSPRPRLTSTTAPRITGVPRVGQTLTADPGAWNGAPSFTYQWFRNGVATGAASSRSTYSVTPSDAARAIHVVVTAAQTGYTSGSARSGTTTIAKVASTTTVAFTATRTTISKRLVASITVTASGIARPGGYVTVFNGTQKLKKLTLATDGTASYRLPRLAAGKRKIKVVYSGGSQVAGSSRTTTITVTKR